MKTDTKRIATHSQETESVWITGSIKNRIKRRKEFNRQVRRATSEEGKKI